MAFNLMHSFRKYQKVLMAGVLFLCMITFVLCTGLGQGGLEDRVLGWFRSTFNQGKGVVTVNGKVYTAQQIDELKKNRDMANEYMRAALSVTSKQVEEMLKIKEKELKKGGIEGDELEQLKMEKDILEEVFDQMQSEISDKKRYFEPGTKPEELVDFLCWREEAIRLGVLLMEKDVKNQLEMDLTLPILRANNYLRNNKFKEMHPGLFWNSKTHYETLGKVRENHHYADYDNVVQALKEEFQVQIVQFALLGTRMDPNSNGPDMKKLGYTVRFAPTPHQLFLAFKEDMTQFDVAMLPIKVDEFLSKLKDKAGKPLEPTKGQLIDLFEKGKNKKDNPASDAPGFIQPEKAKIQYVTADPENQYYKDAAKLVDALQSNPPFFADMANPGLGVLLRQAAVRVGFETAVEKNYLEDQKAYLSGELDFFPFEQVPLTQENFVMPLAGALMVGSPDAKPKPEGVAGLVGSLLTPPGQLPIAGLIDYQSIPSLLEQHKETLEEAIKTEKKSRLALGATLFLAGASPSYYPLMGTANYYSFLSNPAAVALLKNKESLFLPFEVVRLKYLEQKEKKTAVELAKSVMSEVNRTLEEALKSPGGKNEKGRAIEIKKRLNDLKKTYQEPNGIQVFTSDDYVNQYNVDKNPGLAKLKKSFKDTINGINYFEGRNGTDKELHEEDFYKLFFASGEPFSISSASPYLFQKWPPTVTPPQAIKMNPLGKIADLEKGVQFSLWAKLDNRFLFWKTDFKEQVFPEKLEDVKDKVIEAWKLQEARKLAFAEAKEIAERLFKEHSKEESAEYLTLLKENAAKFKIDLITFDKAAKKELILKQVKTKFGAKKVNTYEPRKIGKDVVPYPRDEMSKELFSLFNLKKPLPYWKEGQKDEEQTPGNDVAVDEQNKKLFNKDGAKQVQILTNKARTIYYIAVVHRVYDDKDLAMKDFLAIYAKNKQVTKEADPFLQEVRAEKAMHLWRAEILDQLRVKYVKDKHLDKEQ